MSRKQWTRLYLNWICSGSCIKRQIKSQFYNVCCFLPDGVASDDSAVPGKNDEVRASRRYGGRVCHHRRKCVWRLCQVWGELQSQLLGPFRQALPERAEKLRFETSCWSLSSLPLCRHFLIVVVVVFTIVLITINSS